MVTFPQTQKKDCGNFTSNVVMAFLAGAWRRWLECPIPPPYACSLSGKRNMKKNLIRIVVPGDGDYLANAAGGGGWKKPLRDVDDNFRNQLVSQVEGVEREFSAAFELWKVPG